jgi:hypothetical protein
VSSSTAQRHRQAAAGTPATVRPVDDTRITEITSCAAVAPAARISGVGRGGGHDLRSPPGDPPHPARRRRPAVVVVGPCSIHDYDAAIDYATRRRGTRELEATSRS